MTAPLEIFSCGAVTPIGLNALQTAAAYRAGLAGFQMIQLALPPEEPLRVARIPAHASLRKTPRQWLVNLATRALRECLSQTNRERIGLIISLPETARRQTGFDGIDPEHFPAEVAKAISHQRFAFALQGGEGAAGIVRSLTMARDFIARGDTDLCVLGGVDSLVNDKDIDRLRTAGRLLTPENPQGLIPGEGAGFILVGLEQPSRRGVARIAGFGEAMEPDPASGDRFSQGEGFRSALILAANDAGIAESDISWRISTMNGERYSAWESMFYATRYYRTRRESLPVWFTASRLGDPGAAGGVLGLILAAHALAGGYATGPVVMCESASDSGERGACLLDPALHNPVPPFRPENGVSKFIAEIYGA